MSIIMAVKSAVLESAVDAVEVNDSADVVEEGLVVSVATDITSAIAALNTPGAAFYSSVKGGDFAARKVVAKALTSSTPIDEHLGETLMLANIIVMPVELADEEGNVNTAPRIILIDVDGVAYHATSVGLLSAVRNLFASIGEPEEWPEAQAIKIVQQKGRNGFRFFTINLI